MTNKSTQTNKRFLVLDDDQEAISLTLFQLDKLVELYNNSAGSCPVSLDDAENYASDTDNQTRQTIYEFGIERDFDFSQDCFIDDVVRIKVNTYTTMPKTKEAFEALIIAANKSGFYRPEDAANFQPSKVPRYLLTKGKQVLILSDLSRERIDHDIDNNEWLMAGA